jgi:hypothetical protein
MLTAQHQSLRDFPAAEVDERFYRAPAGLGREGAPKVRSSGESNRRFQVGVPLSHRFGSFAKPIAHIASPEISVLVSRRAAGRGSLRPRFVEESNNPIKDLGGPEPV